MAALINSIIPKSGYEVCRDAIGAILLVELTNQKALQGTAFTENIEGRILLESAIPADAVNQVTLNVMPIGGDFISHNQNQATANYKYFIEIHTSGINSSDSGFRLDKFLGMCGYIFRSAQYRTLGIKVPQGIIGGVYVESIDVEDPHKREDSDFNRFGRLQIAVKVQEFGAVWDAVPLEINNTKVKLENTDKGFIFVFNN